MHEHSWWPYSDTRAFTQGWVRAVWAGSGEMSVPVAWSPVALGTAKSAIRLRSHVATCLSECLAQRSLWESNQLHFSLLPLVWSYLEAQHKPLPNPNVRIEPNVWLTQMPRAHAWGDHHKHWCFQLSEKHFGLFFFFFKFLYTLRLFVRKEILKSRFIQFFLKSPSSIFK